MITYMKTKLADVAYRVWIWAQGGEQITIARAAVEAMATRTGRKPEELVTEVIERMKAVEIMNYEDTRFQKVDDHAAQCIVDLLALIEAHGGDADRLVREILD